MNQTRKDLLPEGIAETLEFGRGRRIAHRNPTVIYGTRASKSFEGSLSCVELLQIAVSAVSLFNPRPQHVPVHRQILRLKIRPMGAHRAREDSRAADGVEVQVFGVDEEGGAEGAADDVAAGVEVGPALDEAGLFAARALRRLDAAAHRRDR